MSRVLSHLTDLLHHLEATGNGCYRSKSIEEDEEAFLCIDNLLFYAALRVSRALSYLWMFN